LEQKNKAEFLLDPELLLAMALAYLLCLAVALLRHEVVRGIEGESEVCYRSCLDSPQLAWPPIGFNLSERTVRCSSRYSSDRVS